MSYRVTRRVNLERRNPKDCMKQLKSNIKKMENATSREEFSDAFHDAEDALSGVYGMLHEFPSKCNICGRF